MLTYNFITGDFYRDGVKLVLKLTSKGYPRIGYAGKTWLAHRLAYVLMGEPLPPMVDHINRNPVNTQWCNLREATNQQNQQNAKARRSGLKGAFYDKARGKWKAAIRVDGKLQNLGRFNSEREAHAAYCEAANQHCGEFARAA